MKSNDLLTKMFEEHEEYMKTHALVQVYCCYAVELPKDYDPNNEEHKRALLDKFVKENEVNVIETTDGTTRQYFKMKDGRCNSFDGIELME